MKDLPSASWPMRLARAIVPLHSLSVGPTARADPLGRPNHGRPSGQAERVRAVQWVHSDAAAPLSSPGHDPVTGRSRPTLTKCMGSKGSSLRRLGLWAFICSYFGLLINRHELGTLPFLSLASSSWSPLRGRGRPSQTSSHMTLAKLLVQKPELNAHKKSAPVKKGLDKWK